MKKYFSIIIIISFTLLSCSSSRKNSSGMDNNSQGAVLKRDALSFETAIIIKEKNERAGVKAEYDWIKEHYANYSIEGQKLSSFKKTPYDVITIVLSDNKKVPLYFDISNFFGKF